MNYHWCCEKLVSSRSLADAPSYYDKRVNISGRHLLNDANF